MFYAVSTYEFFCTVELKSNSLHPLSTSSLLLPPDFFYLQTITNHKITDQQITRNNFFLCKAKMTNRFFPLKQEQEAVLPLRSGTGQITRVSLALAVGPAGRPSRPPWIIIRRLSSRRVGRRWRSLTRCCTPSGSRSRRCRRRRSPDGCPSHQVLPGA